MCRTSAAQHRKVRATIAQLLPRSLVCTEGVQGRNKYLQELRGIQRVCEVQEQTVAQLKQRLRAEEERGMTEGTLRVQLAALQDEVKVVLNTLMLSCRKFLALRALFQ